MKRKLFSAILFGALLTASTSGLTSCKDYDDDIQNLQSQIDKLATAEQLSAKVTELQGQIEKAKADAVSAADAAKKVGEAAQKSADDAASAAAAAKKAAEDIAASAATKDDLKAAADAAQKAVEAIQSEVAGKTSPEDVKAAIDAALADVLAEVEEHHNAILELDEELNGEGGIAERLAAAEQAIEEGAAEVDLAPIKQLIEDFEKKAQEILGTAFEMVTSVDLFTTRAAQDANFTSLDLVFAQVKELRDLTFPANGEADGTCEFKKDAYKMYGDSLLIRVSPIESVLKPENISLINSQGLEVSSDLVKVTDVVPYTRNKPLTRSAESNGLWVVKFKVEDDVKADDFVKVAGKNEAGKKVLFAVAVNNTKEETDSRRVISTYDVTMAYGKAVASSDLFVNNISIYRNAAPSQWVNGIHNRYTTTEDNTQLPAAVKGKDVKWKYDGVTPFQFASDLTATDDNTQADNRQYAPVLLVKEGEDINISYPANQPIKGFYVALDYTRACESGESELNAWNSYKYENVAKFASDGKLIEQGKFFNGNTGTIKVAALSEAQRLAGDIIGFRVFAVNLDGTFVDPDGQAFYVGIKGTDEADNVELAAAEAEVTKVSPAAGKNWTGAIDFTAAKAGMSDVTIGGWAVEGAPQSANTTFRSGTDFVVSTLKADGSAATTVKDIATLKIQLTDPTKFVDGATYTFKTTLNKTVGSATYAVRNISVKVTKKMPGVPTNIKFSGDEDKYQPIYAVGNNYAGITVADVATGVKGNTTPKAGLLKLGKFLVYDNSTNAPIDSYTEYSYDISNSKYTWDNTLSTPAYVLGKGVADNASSWDLSVVSKETLYGVRYTYLVDCNTTHSITSNYSYGYISYRKDAGETAYSVKEWKPSTLQTPEVVFMSWACQSSGFTTYKVAKYSNNQTGSNYKDCTFNEIAWVGLNNNMTIGAASTSTWTVPSDRQFSLNNVRVKFGLKVTNMASQPFTTSTSLGNLLKNGYLKLIAAWTEVPAADGSTATNKFVEPTVNGTKDDITLKQVANTSSDHSEILKLQVVDCFNYKQIIEVPISIVTTVSSTVYNAKEITFN